MPANNIKMRLCSFLQTPLGFTLHDHNQGLTALYGSYVRLVNNVLSFSALTLLAFGL